MIDTWAATGVGAYSLSENGLYTVEGWKAADAKALADYLAGPAPGTVLALVGEGLKKDSPLAKACAKKGELLFYDVQKRELAPWVAEQFGRVGASGWVEEPSPKG